MPGITIVEDTGFGTLDLCLENLWNKVVSIWEYYQDLSLQDIRRRQRWRSNHRCFHGRVLCSKIEVDNKRGKDGMHGSLEIGRIERE